MYSYEYIVYPTPGSQQTLQGRFRLRNFEEVNQRPVRTRPAPQPPRQRAVPDRGPRKSGRTACHVIRTASTADHTL